MKSRKKKVAVFSISDDNSWCVLSLESLIQVEYLSKKYAIPNPEMMGLKLSALL